MYSKSVQIVGLASQVLDRFVTAFTAVHSEKDQRGVIKQLLAAVGGDEVRAGAGTRVKKCACVWGGLLSLWDVRQGTASGQVL